MKKLFLLAFMSMSSIHCMFFHSYDERKNSLVFQGDKVIVAYKETSKFIYPICEFHQLPVTSTIVFFVKCNDQLISYDSARHGKLFLTEQKNLIDYHGISFHNPIYSVRSDFVCYDNLHLSPFTNYENLKTYPIDRGYGTAKETPSQVMQPYPHAKEIVAALMVALGCYIYCTQQATP